MSEVETITKTTTDKIKVQVIYALPDKYQVIDLEVNSDCTAKAAVEQSNIVQLFPDIDLDTIKLGVFGKTVKADLVLKAGDRVEIYRPLIVDPKASRRNRAEKAKAKKEQAE